MHKKFFFTFILTLCLCSFSIFAYDFSSGTNASGTHFRLATNNISYNISAIPTGTEIGANLPFL